ncbi:MAG TPA: Fe-S cluster assembly protein SufD [Terracidiphilus sp.]|nr:Fe-S cluster assembly protein SufD [Terracidiphilus sp.]
MATALRSKNYQEAFAELEQFRQASEPVWLRHLRAEGWEIFNSSGFPTVRDEDWRFTNLAPLTRTEFRRAPETKISRAAIDSSRLASAACQLVFVNGRFAPELSELAKLPAGLEVSGLAQALNKKADSVEQHLGRYANLRRDAFAALNTALWEDGACIHIRRDAQIEQPVHLLFVTTESGGPVMTHPRSLIIAEQASQAAIVEHYVSLGAGAALSNSVTELAAADDAIISHYLVERENFESFNISTLRLEQARNANVSSHSILLGGGLVRNNVHPVLNGPGAECLINGLFVGGGRQHLDNYMLVEHASPHGSSRQFYNGILDQHARGVFHGRIVVHKDAQKTDAKQTNRNLLLSDDARMDTKPQLEIRADDVKCTHGATIGRIEDEPLFYLRSRGLDEASARNLLLYAFAAECLDRMKEEPAREFVEQFIRRRLEEIATTSQAVPPPSLSLAQDVPDPEEVA